MSSLTLFLLLTWLTGTLATGVTGASRRADALLCASPELRHEYDPVYELHRAHRWTMIGLACPLWPFLLVVIAGRSLYRAVLEIMTDDTWAD